MCVCSGSIIGHAAHAAAVWQGMRRVNVLLVIATSAWSPFVIWH